MLNQRADFYWYDAIIQCINNVSFILDRVPVPFIPQAELDLSLALRYRSNQSCLHHESMAWKRIPGIHRSPSNFPQKGHVIQTFEIFFGVSLNKLSSPQLSCRWFETSCRLCDVTSMGTFRVRDNCFFLWGCIVSCTRNNHVLCDYVLHTDTIDLRCLPIS